jgi:putative transcriptional regulator
MRKSSAARPKGEADWPRLRAFTDEEIERQAAAEARELGTDFNKGRSYIGFNSTVPNVKKIRDLLGLSQHDFALRFRLSERTIQQWEQGRAEPDQPARVLLHAIALAPEELARAIRRAIPLKDPVRRRAS